MTGAGAKGDNDLFSLPPEQLKKELQKRIEKLQLEIVKQQKERQVKNSNLKRTQYALVLLKRTLRD